MYTEEVSIYSSQSITQEARECIQKRCLYIPINQLHRGGKRVYTEEVAIYTKQSITQRR